MVLEGSGVVVLSDDLTSCVLGELQPVRKTPASKRETTARTRVLPVRLEIKHQPSIMIFICASQMEKFYGISFLYINMLLKCGKVFVGDSSLTGKDLSK